MTIGRRVPLAAKRTSCIRRRPCDDVAVNARPPAALAPNTALMAENSASTGTNSNPYSGWIRDSSWGIWVEGVIGNAATTSGLHRATAWATAMLPSMIFSVI